jgi:ribose transport system ATP-binding protein
MVTPSDAAPLLRLEGLEKVFPNGTAALRGVDLQVKPGEVHGLLGANGAGKSTLIKILAGAFRATAGDVWWRGDRVSWTRPSDPRAAGVATVQQHIPLVPTLSVLENVFLYERGLWRRDPSHRRRFGELLERIGYRFDPDALVGDLPIGQRQMVAILQALSGGADLVIMDEPTASLANEERELVYRTVKRLSRTEGKAILFVSHFLDEIFALTDAVTVLRDGRAVLHATTAELTEHQVAEAIAGRAVAALTRPPPRPPRPHERPLCEVVGLASEGFGPCSFTVAPGEVVGIAGLLGSGRSELLHAMFGADPHATGEVRIDGQPVARSPAAAIRAGVGLVGEDRMRQGIVPGFELWRNTTLAHLDEVSWAGLFPVRAREVAEAEAAIRLLGIKARDPDSLVTELSGGNAQKVTIGRWLFGGTRLYLLDEPTAGIDVGAKADILQLIRELAAGGAGVLLVSSEFEELLAVSDRILIMRDGRFVAERAGAEATEHDLILLAGGAQAPDVSPVEPRGAPQ